MTVFLIRVGQEFVMETDSASELMDVMSELEKREHARVTLLGGKAAAVPTKEIARHEPDE